MKIILGNSISQLVIGGMDHVIDPALISNIRDYMSVKVPGAYFIQKHTGRGYDGKKYYCTPAGKVHTGMISILLSYLQDEYQDLEVEIMDERTGKVSFRKDFDPTVGDYSMGGDYDFQMRLTQAFNHTITFRDQKIYFPRGIVDAATNAGKTTIIAGIFNNTDADSMLVLIHRKAIYKQLVDFLGGIFGEVGQINDKYYDLKPVTVAMVQSLANRVKDGVTARADIKSFPALVVDECFAGGTLVSGKKIKDYKIGDYVFSYNHYIGAVEHKKITYIFKKPIDEIVKVTFSNGKTIVCTKDHPFFSDTYNGYLEISKLNRTFVLNIEGGQYASKEKLGTKTMYPVRDYGGSKDFCTEKTAQKKQNVLFRGVQNDSNFEGGQGEGIFSGVQSKIRFRENEEKQPYEGPSSQGQSEYNPTCDEPRTKSAWWKWYWSNSVAAIIGARYRMGHGNSYTYKGAKGFRISNLLQSRYSKRIINDCNRSRWVFPSGISKKGARSKENRIFGKLRVESIEIYKQGSGDGFEQLCPESIVYNLEVEDNNNYFANGILVHNCHRAGSKTYKTVLKHSDAYLRVFLSGTALDSDDVVAKLDSIAASGPRLAEVKKVELMDKGISTPVEIRMHLCNTLLFQPVVDYRDIIEECIYYSNQRVDIMRRLVEASTGAMLIAVDKIAHGQFIYDSLKEMNVTKSIEFTHGLDTHQLDKIDAFKTGNIDVLIATSILSEGVNIPIISEIIYASGGRSKISVKQTCGRGERLYEAKKKTVFHDFYDCGRFVGKHSEARLKIYKDEDLPVFTDFDIKDARRLKPIVIQ